MDYSLFMSLDDDTRRKLIELRRRHDAGEIQVEWSKTKEPDCEHSGWNGNVRSGPQQPASMCRICSEGPELAAWRRYWNGLLRSIP